MATLTLQLDDDLLHRAEEYSARRGQSLSDLITEYLAEFGRKAPSSERKRTSLFGSMRGTAEIVGDIVSPLSAEDWEVLRS